MSADDATRPASRATAEAALARWDGDARRELDLAMSALRALVLDGREDAAL